MLDLPAKLEYARLVFTAGRNWSTVPCEANRSDPLLLKAAPTMPDLEIRPVTTRGEKKQFIQFPWDLYRDDPNWIPPLRGELKGLLGYTAHPFYERNKVQTFLALRGKEVLGRIAAIVNYGHIERHDDRRGFFGFFDCVDQQEVAAGLFDVARQWLAQHDLHKIRGPMNPSMNYELGLLIEGFETPPVFMMTYNRPYYQRLVETYGFKERRICTPSGGIGRCFPASRKNWPPSPTRSSSI